MHQRGRRVTVISGRVMGLMTAYHAAPPAEAVTVLERSWAGAGRSDELVADDELMFGPVPGADEVFAGVGWRDTGDKLAPWVGRVLAQLALPQDTGYDIRRFAPARFAGGCGPGGLKAGGAVS
jgi:glycine/D-amino acid oxidase-like deaminating enzyme